MNDVDIDRLNFSKLNGLIPAVVQHALSGSVLMVGFMNRQAVEATVKTRRATFWSRTRQRLWEKGEVSGNAIEIRSMAADCDNDSLLLAGLPAGPVCHTGAPACFPVPDIGGSVVDRLDRVIEDRRKNLPEGSYTATLFREGTDRIAQKVGEEAVETLLAAVSTPDRLPAEAADLVFHLMVLLRHRGYSFIDVERELEQRSGGGQIRKPEQHSG